MRTAIPEVPVGIGAPNVWSITFVPGDSGLDLTTVTGVSLAVTREVDGTTAIWTATIQAGATATEMVARFAFTGAEVTTLGLYEVAPTLTVPGGTIPSSALKLFAVAPQRLAWEGPSSVSRVWSVG